MFLFIAFEKPAGISRCCQATKFHTRPSKTAPIFSFFFYSLTFGLEMSRFFELNFLRKLLLISAWLLMKSYIAGNRIPAHFKRTALYIKIGITE